LAWNALQLPGATVLELDARTDDEVFHRLRYQYVTRTGCGTHTSTNVNGDASQAIACQLAFACVHARPHVNANVIHGMRYRDRTPDRTGRTVEGCKEPVSGVIDLPAAVALELVPRQAVVPF
jgi:hypothetical protein